MPLLIDFSTIAIRKARQQDKSSLCAIHRRAVSEISGNYYTPKEIRQWLNSLKPESYEKNIEDHEFIIAEYRGGVIGFGHMDIANSLVAGIYVSPDYIRRGIGTMLLQRLEHKAGLSGLRALQLCSSLNALPFYEQAGYKAYLHMRRQLPDGTEIPCIYMIKKLLAADALN